VDVEAVVLVIALPPLVKVLVVRVIRVVIMIVNQKEKMVVLVDLQETMDLVEVVV
tara:strand:+ start:62 stop:226 length:165 start_codon:yes stop_codon:yes gene_type:complete